MKPHIIIIGNGQIGSALSVKADDFGFLPYVLDRHKLDLLNVGNSQIDSLIDEFEPQCVINAAAYTAVDKAESLERVEAFKINAEAPAILAASCRKNGVLFVHYSTDYVFDGTKTNPWIESDAPNPINFYGHSKLKGEQAVAEFADQYLIFRTSWVYDEYGKNFMNTMLKLGKERENLNVVADQIGAPTYASHIAEATLKSIAFALGTEISGLFHMSNAGATSWFEFANEVFKEAKSYGNEYKLNKISAIATSEYKTDAKRPLNSLLDNSKLKNQFGISLPTWQEGLQECMKNKYGSI